MDSFPTSLDSAIAEFEQRRNKRVVEELKLRKAKELIRRELWDDALRMLRPLWHSMSWRKEGWWDIVEDVGWALRSVAAKNGDGASIVSVDWELMHKSTWSRFDSMKSAI